MRLLHTTEIYLQEFFDQDVPPYACISHRWSKEELSYHDLVRDRPKLLEGQYDTYGWIKIAKACELARQQGLDWVWIDTCCIDKTSSAELSEAINSMFMWYARCYECYAFLPDVHEPPTESQSLVRRGERDFLGIHSMHFNRHEFVQSEWFTRAWTLQELLAPQRVFFFDSGFNCVGSKKSLAYEIFLASDIVSTYLTCGRSKILEACVAERMKWASKRKATREEDIAYSLLGLFDVNMPLLYGEGKKAFQRLQTEIIRSSTDESIFAWNSELAGRQRGFLAPDIKAFNLDVFARVIFAREHYEITNKGLRFTLSLPRRRLEESLRARFSASIVIVLNCAPRVQDINRDMEYLLCLCTMVNEDPQWANATEPDPRHLRYLLGSRISFDRLSIPKGHRSTVLKRLDERIRSDDIPGGSSKWIVAGSGAQDEIDIPVYFWTGDANSGS